MLFALTYTYRASASEATVKRLYTLFGNWQPPKGYEIKSHSVENFGKADCRLLIFEEK